MDPSNHLKEDFRYRDRSETGMKRMLRKSSQLTVFLLLFTALFPILAFAATGFKDVVYKNGSVTGSVYSDVYNPDITSAVYMYDPSGNNLGTANVTGVTYSVYEGVYTYYYNFSGSVSNSFNYLNLLEQVTSSVYAAVYNTTPSSGGSSGGRGGGGGGGSYGSSSLSVSSDGTIDAGTLANSLRQYDVVELNLNGTFVLIPASALTEFAGTNKVLKVIGESGTYVIPVKSLDLTALAKKVDTTTDELTIKVSVAPVAEETTSGIAAAASSIGASPVGTAVDFNAEAIGKDNKTEPVVFTSYVDRNVTLDKTIDSNKATGALYDPVTKKLSFVPSTFAAEDDKTVVTYKRNGSSIYTVVELSKSFADVKGHWSQSYVELLASKLVVDGVTDSSFEPDRNISRAEFAALVVRSLGLGQGTYNGGFADVTSDAWYAGVVGAAAAAGIIDGYEDGTFRPDQQISREELAAMVVRAMKAAGVSTELEADQQAALLAKYSDASRIVWAQKEIAAAIDSGLIEGMTDSTIGSDLQATRAQSATMLKRFLGKAGFIN
jgi:N-acetylmuramoyl-L-alanine amidase